MTLASVLLIAGVILLISVLVVTYVLAVTSRHVHAILPYISSTGNYPIESCIFSAGLNLSAAVLMVLVIVRYWQILAIIETDSAAVPENKKNRRKKENRASLVFGLSAALGLSMAGSFQQKVFRLFHGYGAFLCSGGIFLYNIFQTAFSFTLLSAVTSVHVRRLRLVLLIFVCASSLTVFGLGYFIWSNDNYDNLEGKPPTENDNRSNSTVTKIVTSSEWVFFSLNLMLLCTYYPDFKRISLKKDEVSFLE